MAGAGQRFAEAGYRTHKPAIPTIDRKTGERKPMVVCAVLDLPGILPEGENLIFIERIFHQTDGVEADIRRYFPQARFIAIDHLTQGQASTCLLAQSHIDGETPLLIAACDNGMAYDRSKFEAAQNTADVLVFTYRNHENVLRNPNAHGWMMTDDAGNVVDVSVKKAVSDDPVKDHAVVATFWFRHGSIFVRSAEAMIAANDRVNGEFYVDQTIKYVLNQAYRVKVFEIDRYIGWGTPQDYEQYTKTYLYWKDFYRSDQYLGD
jgi:bifunctional N-acetylglucosamine-1-phosphate-uridyltransferase/glucosamine-1-phosphate-acetyltransferase GlmU-like protein